ncbi:MAG: PEP-utilizing enzyme [Candidatus Gracilibacteria bacterium]
MKNLPFKPTDNIFKWGPVPGHFQYISTFSEVHFKQFRAKYDENWSETFFLFKNGRMFWLNEVNAVHAAGEKVFVRYMLPKESRDTIYQEWKKSVQGLESIIANINATSLSSTTNEELLTFWNELHRVFINFWVDGSVPELGNYGSPQLIERKLREIISDEKDMHAIMETLTAPIKLSFYQEEEIDLAETSDIEAHQKRFFWLKNSYAGTQVLTVEFFAERKKELSSDIRKSFEEKLQQTKEKKAEFIKTHNLPSEIIEIATAMSEGIEWQDERKKWIFITLHYVDILLKEVAQRFSYDYQSLHNLWYHEIPDIIEGKDLKPTLEKRATGFGIHFLHDCEELTSEEAAYVWNTFDQHDASASTTELKGIVASKGKGTNVTAKVRILLDPMQVDSFQDGEILIAPMTSPEYIFAMRKASAVITDTGGLTSHAAIVTRELGIPCLVGTKSATKILKDGDTVEINITTGTAKKI